MHIEVTLQIHQSHIMQKMLADSFADLVRMPENSVFPARLREV